MKNTGINYDNGVRTLPEQVRGLSTCVFATERQVNENIIYSEVKQVTFTTVDRSNFRFL